jgi:hypothetical protein
LSQLLHYLFRFALIIFGFICAIVAASIFLNMLLIGGSEWIGDEGPFLYMTVPAFAVVIGYSVFIPAAVLILYAELTSWVRLYSLSSGNGGRKRKTSVPSQLFLPPVLSAVSSTG